MKSETRKKSKKHLTTLSVCDIIIPKEVITTLLDELVESINNEYSKKLLKYVKYLYLDIVTDDNRALLDEYTSTLVEALRNNSETKPQIKFHNQISMDFYQYLLNSGKTHNTAYDYCRRVERICKDNSISIEDLFFRRTGCSINDLVGMYSDGGIKSEDNKRLHNAPLSALKRFRDFMNRE